MFASESLEIPALFPKKEKKIQIREAGLASDTESKLLTKVRVEMAQILDEAHEIPFAVNTHVEMNLASLPSLPLNTLKLYIAMFFLTFALHW